MRVFSIILARLATMLARLLGYKGTNLGGEVALRISPGILGHFGSQVKRNILFVTGTNGKTSTNNMIYSIVRQTGASCVANRLGANLDAGLISAFVEESNIWGKVDADYACLEVDESTLPKVLTQLKPNAILFTNIFQERRSKTSDIDVILGNIKAALRRFKDVGLILNADDPYLVDFGQSMPNPKFYFGFDTRANMGGDAAKSAKCKRCGIPLKYHHRFYAHLGHYHCRECGFHRPTPEVIATVDDGGKRLSVLGTGSYYGSFDTNSADNYSLYNFLAACAYAVNIGLDSNAIKQGIEGYKPQPGRMEEFNLEKRMILNLAKNPVGFDESMKVVCQDPRQKTIILGINNLPQDGTDVSWLWDTNFEILKDAQVENYITFGRCSKKMARRLRDAGIKSSKIHTMYTAEEAVDLALQQPEQVVYLLVNYSLLFETRKLFTN